MTAGDIRDEIRLYVLEKLDARGVRDIRDDDSLAESGVADSLGIFQLIDFVEARCGIRVADGEIHHDNFRTIDALVAFVVRKRGGDAASTRP
jgi:acyl carrier protein